jgi:phage baseplate assembly protein W
LDIKEVKARSFNAKESNKDLQRIINEESVIASLRNIFNTSACSRLLNPEMNFEIKKYLFEPITQYKAWFIGYDIHTQLPVYEPRIRVNHVKVSASIEQNCYYIELSVSIPTLQEDLNLSSVLS